MCHSDEEETCLIRMLKSPNNSVVTDIPKGNPDRFVRTSKSAKRCLDGLKSDGLLNYSANGH